MEKWYKKLYRRNLVDMHVADWNDEFLSKFSAEQYFDCMQTANIQSPMIYLQSHTGLCNFPTKVSKTHEFFKKNPDEINKLIDLCHNAKMKVVGYYSLIFNNQAVYDHPDWEMVNYDETTWRDHGQRYGLCCPNNPDYREFLKVQIQELKDFYPTVDALFYDMPYWEVVCHCPSCKARWQKEVGGELPEKLDWKNEKWRLFVRKRQEWMGEFAHFVKNETEKVFSGITVELNFAAVIGCDYLAGSTELINDACEFTGGDLYGDLYNHSFTAKYYYAITKNQPFEYMTCRCNHTLREHTISKSPLTEEAEVMLTAMHHGATLLIDAINPDGTLDKRVYEQMGKVFAKEMPYEKYMDKGELYSDVAVYFDSTTQFTDDNRYMNKEGAIGAVRTLIENHIPVSVIANGCKNLEKYKLIVAPELADFDNKYIENFISYVKFGGILYLSGKSESRLIKEFFGGKVTGYTYGDSKYKHVFKGYDEVQAYIAPTTEKYQKIFGAFNEKYPLPITYKLPVMENYEGEVQAKIVFPYTDPDDNTVFASIHSNPPAYMTEYPAIITTNYGLGKVIWSGASLENDGRYNFKDVFSGIVKEYVTPKYTVDTSKFVETVYFEDGKTTYFSLLDLNFAQDVVERKFTVYLDGEYEIENLTTGEKCTANGSYSASFEKYVWYKMEKK